MGKKPEKMEANRIFPKQKLPDFKVTTRCITFNHAPYILDALNGFVIQKTSFPALYIIIDDASTDGAQDIIKKYMQEEFSFNENSEKECWEHELSHFLYVRHPKNQNCYFLVMLLKRNLYREGEKKKMLYQPWINLCEYRAECEGDDYWTDATKLQQQVVFLETHPDYSMCFHSVYYDRNGNLSDNDLKCNYDCDFTTQDVIIGGGDFCGTCSLVLKRDLFEKTYIFKEMANVSDYPLQIICSLEGKVHYFHGIMGCYRKQSVGSWTQRTTSNKQLLFRFLRNEISWMSELNYETGCKYQSAIYYKLAFLVSYNIEAGFATNQELIDYINRIKYWKLEKNYRLSYLELMLYHKHQRLYRIWKYKNFTSLLYLFSPTLCGRYINWRTGSIIAKNLS